MLLPTACFQSRGIFLLRGKMQVGTEQLEGSMGKLGPKLGEQVLETEITVRGASLLGPHHNLDPNRVLPYAPLKIKANPFCMLFMIFLYVVPCLHIPCSVARLTCCFPKTTCLQHSAIIRSHLLYSRFKIHFQCFTYTLTLYSTVSFFPPSLPFFLLSVLPSQTI